MEENFMKLLKETIKNDKNNSLIRTENGALEYKSSGRKLVNLNYAVSSLRDADPQQICDLFDEAYAENPKYAILWLFYASDIRGGLGERRLFRILLKHLCKLDLNYVDWLWLIPLVPVYSRWDNLWCLMDNDVPDSIHRAVVDFVIGQLDKDMMHMHNHESISLLAKWMPSNNTSSRRSRELALKFEIAFGITSREYRKMLSALRRYLDLVEIHASKNDWGGIDYNKVPSRANLMYRNAFAAHDKARYNEYIQQVTEGKAKINGSVNFPHDIVHQYMKDSYYSYPDKSIDNTIEALWKALPDYVAGGPSTLVVADASGSMLDTIDKSGVTAIEVAFALGIYFAEKLPEPYHNKMITFSANPDYLYLPGTSLLDNLKTLYRHSEMTNTNIEKTMALILRTAIENNLTQDQLPRNILILSDMEFDAMADIDDSDWHTRWAYNQYWENKDYVAKRKSSFDKIVEKFKEAGYKMPKITFWNLKSRTRGIPLKENELGVNLVSGFSPAVVKLVMTEKSDPYEALKEILDSDRYKPVADVID